MNSRHFLLFRSSLVLCMLTFPLINHAALTNIDGDSSIGIDISDAVNIGQLINNNAVKESNIYTDSKVMGLVEELNAYTNQSVDHLSSKVDRNYNRANAGIAGALAQNAIPQQFGFDRYFGMAIGNYRNGTAIAAGGGAQIKNNMLSKTAISWDTGGGIGISTGVSVSW